ncbi:DUF4190 domain-containing protein [Rossellomorea marisflavi]|uniref:DUF4190 domain-containing protein n=2 Tax=Bacillaceae TaxID=186817 RepID=A0A5D4S6A3_9BACI|nr:DUF4190 domain-containing protein [Bacillus sp. JRC01]TYS57282.1 DUF4190 domain-containing protein [Rossellomorea marisflavi]UKS67574.1 DUF4190 domain-containing protein [Rossellomorea marisflavi]
MKIEREDEIGFHDTQATNLVTEDYREETATEIAAPLSIRDVDAYERDEVEERSTSGSVMGYSALALSILSLFILPVILGAVGIVLGFVARRRGAETLGAWAIGVGAVSLIIGIFVLPFF